jgi:hypothetical protein
MQKTCVKCGYMRRDSDVAPEYECPRCGVVYAKVEAAMAAANAKTPSLAIEGNSAEAILPKHRKRRLFAIIGIAILVVGIASWFGYKKIRRANAEAALRDAISEFLLKEVTKNLFDPSSVQYQGLKIHNYAFVLPDGTEVDYGFAACGELNAKNRLGGYVGYRRFYSTVLMNPNTGELVLDTLHSHLAKENENDPFWLRAYNETCKNVREPAPAKAGS